MIGFGLCDRCGNAVSFRDYNPDVNLVDGRIICNKCLEGTSVPSNTFIHSNIKNDPVDVIALILDKSSSMGDVKQAAISAVNEFIRTQQNVPGEAVYYGIQFSTVYDIVSDLNDIKNFVPLNEKTYMPSGMTALYDAIGRTIIDLESKLTSNNLKTNKVIVAIQTDGEENSSTEFREAEVSRLIERKQADGWEFVMLGSGWNTHAAAAKLHIQKDHVMQYKSTAKGTLDAFACSSRSFASYRSGLVKGISLPPTQDLEDPTSSGKSFKSLQDLMDDFVPKVDPNRFPPKKKK